MFSLRGRSVDLVAVGSADGESAEGTHPQGLALARDPEPARRALKVENIEGATLV